MSGVRLSLLLVTIALASACTAERPVPAPTASPSPLVIPTRPVEGPARTDAVAWVSEDAKEVRVYAVALDAVRTLARAPSGYLNVGLPRFRLAAAVTFTASVREGDRARTELREARLPEGEQSVLLSDAEIVDYAWSFDGSVAALLTLTPGARESDLRVELFSPGAGPPRRIATLGRWRGNHHGAAEDESSIAWSPDGSALLVTATDLGPPETPGARGNVFAIGSDGRLVAEPVFGTNARWSPDGRTVYFRDRDDPGPARWRSLDVRTGELTGLAPRVGTVRGAVSPDGRYLAYDDGAAGPSLYIFDLRTGTEIRVARGLVAPVWLRPDRLVASAARRCAQVREDCAAGDEPVSAGAVYRLSVPEGERKRISLETTLEVGLRHRFG